MATALNVGLEALQDRRRRPATLHYSSYSDSSPLDAVAIIHMLFPMSAVAGGGGAWSRKEQPCAKCSPPTPKKPFFAQPRPIRTLLITIVLVKELTQQSGSAVYMRTRFRKVLKIVLQVLLQLARQGLEHVGESSANSYCTTRRKDEALAPACKAGSIDLGSFDGEVSYDEKDDGLSQTSIDIISMQSQAQLFDYRSSFFVKQSGFSSLCRV